MTGRVSTFATYRCERCDPDNLLPTTLCPTTCSTKGILLLKTLYPNRVGMRTFSVAGKPVRLFLPLPGKFPWHWGPTSPWSSLRAVHWEDRCYNWQAPNSILVAGQGPACSSEPHLTASPFFSPSLHPLHQLCLWKNWSLKASSFSKIYWFCNVENRRILGEKYPFCWASHK